MNKITVMGNDAGSTNYGYSVIKFKVKHGEVSYKILECGQLQNTLKDLKVVAKPILNKYKKEIRAKIKKYGINNMICERFMPRGRFGNTSEFVNIMIGFLLAQKEPVLLLTASTWKNRVNKFIGKKKKGEKLSGLDKFYKIVCVPPHEIDATFQAMYLAEKLLDIEILSIFENKKNLMKLKKGIEKCSTSKKINRRISHVQ